MVLHLSLIHISFINWRNNTGEKFIFSIKASRYITHIKRLVNCNEPLERLFKAAEGLEEKRGPFLFQLPPGLKKDKSVLKNFLETLPQNYKYAFEFRNESWFTEEIYKLLEDFGCAIVISSAPCFPYVEKITADFCYIRMHGSASLDVYKRQVNHLEGKNKGCQYPHYCYSF